MGTNGSFVAPPEESAFPVAPNGLEDAPCDESWRVRLQKRYADYFLGFEPSTSKTATIYIASLNRTDALIWPNRFFQDWAHRLRTAPENRTRNRSLLKTAQFLGGETEIDRQGRFVLPKKTREGLRLDQPLAEFKVFNDGVVRLIRSDQRSSTERAVPEDEELDDYAIDQYSNYLAGILSRVVPI